MGGRSILACALALTCVEPATGRTPVGAWAGWAAFADEGPRPCYAIAAPELARAPAWTSVAVWPARGRRGELHVRLSRAVRPGSAVIATVDDVPFALVARGANAWAATREGERAQVAAMRRGVSMRIQSRDERGRAFTDAYRLGGAASAIDAALIACAARG